jgi:hypothetical protein
MKQLNFSFMNENVSFRTDFQLNSTFAYGKNNRVGFQLNLIEGNNLLIKKNISFPLLDLGNLSNF